MITVIKRFRFALILSLALGGGLYIQFPTQSAKAADPQLAAICSLIDYNDAQKDIAGAAYVAGVDVHGKPVAPAGLNEQGKTVTPQNMSFILSLDLADRYMNLPDGVALDSQGVPLEITPEGQVSVGDADRTQELRALCKDHYGQAIAP
tara:strand:- start:564821 stop:565267 length:447 start_codon:yes stop_codon:yes gene_type:complete